jgi:hypothetical protein
MKGKISAILFCMAGLWLIAGAYAAGEADAPPVQPVVASAQPTVEHLANGPKDIPPGWEKIVFIHYKRPRGKPEGTPGAKPPKPDSKSRCYTFLAKDVKWRDPSNSGCVVDSENGPEGFLAAVSAATGTWAAETTANILPFCEPASDYESCDLLPDENSPDGYNEILFGDLNDDRIIAVTIVWGIFGGPPAQRQIVEYDMVFNSFFTWSDDGREGAMDIQNIATHEFGHALGLGDLYETACAEVTMYGYSTEGETTKQSLESADIAGLQALYGE